MKALFSKPLFWLAIITLIGLALRLYRISDYLQFLGDQGRDVLIVKRMIVDHDFTLLGPTASVGGFYIGPLYYYFMLPFLWLWNLDPVGPAVMSALFGAATIIAIFFFCREFFNTRVAFLASILTLLSPKMIDISRFAWNPNPIPFFAIMAIFLLFLGAKKEKFIYVLLSGLCVGIMQELHYITLVFIPLIYLQTLLIFPRKKIIPYFILLALGIVLGNSLFLIFELRHGFPNTRSAFEFATRDGKTVAPRSLNLWFLFNDVSRQLFEIMAGYRGKFILVLYNFSLISFAVWFFRSLKDRLSKRKAILLATWFVFGALGVGSYQGSLLEHYFSYLFPLPMILIALLGDQLFSIRFAKPVVVLGLVVFIYFQIPTLYFFKEPNRLLSQTKSVSQIVIDLAGGEPYNFALITPGNSDHAYRYFLEIWGHPPTVIENNDVDPMRKTVTSKLIVVCEQKDCEPLGNSLWEVAGFGRAEISEKKVGPAGIIVYRLSHYQELGASPATNKSETLRKPL